MRPVPNAEIELLLLCARMFVGEVHTARIRSLLRGSLDWDRLTLMARRHGLIPFLFRTLSALSASNAPLAVMEKLRAQFGAIRLQNLVYVRELLRALGGLESAGIVVTPYKGPALAAFLFQDVSMRQFSDIDLLVRPGDALKAHSVLLDLGYVPRQQGSARTRSLYARYHYEFSFTTMERQLLVELNWRIAPWYWRLPEVPKSAWNTIGRLPFAGITVPWFRPADVLFLLCMHGCKHKWESVKWIVDVAELLRAYPDLEWREIAEYARRTGSERMLLLGVFLANDLLDTSLSDDMHEAIRSKPSVASLADEVCDNMFAAHPQPADTLAELPFLARATERIETKIFCRGLIPAYYLLHRLVRPGLAALRRAAAG